MSVEPDLHRLTEAERAILRLLAQGHTAKSIAAEIGRSEGAVNERLREARRKTGVGSSRELARMMQARENRDSEIGLVPGGPVPPAPAGAPQVARQPAKVILMTLPFLTLAAAAAVALHGSGQQASTPPTPSLLPGVGDGDAAVAAATLRARFAGEVRDPAWATRMEAALTKRYRATGGPEIAPLTVTCRSTLCSVQGQAVSRIASGGGKRLTDALASPAMRGSVPGLHADVTNTSSFSKAGSCYVSIDALWRRTDRD